MHVVYFERIPKNVKRFSEKMRENKKLRRADLNQRDRNASNDFDGASSQGF
ncbi:hypothetical protein CEV32_1260 [Brucella rhizosphaerae]|uniref:Uncharacterized protein n=1 Tax=Brucella rhizosphaerae TaxID=571254 RepID=A0A256FA83_9HYPH|nr:hypothetical protein CEV32_1260 [Brucella rhizosphaerae]